MRLFREHLALVLTLLLVGLALGRAVRFPFVNWDDGKYLLDNPLTERPLSRGLKSLLLTEGQGYPKPVTVLSFAVERGLFGLQPWVFHATNLVLHLANVVLVYLLCLACGASRRLASWAVLLFALHPLVVEPSVWVTGRKDLLATFFMVGAMLVFARAGASSPGRPTVAALAGSQLLAVLAIGSKASALAGPALLWLSIRRAFPVAGRWRPLLWLSPLLVVAAVMGIAGVRGERAVGSVAPRGAAAAIADVAGALTLQVQHLAWPRDLLPGYYRQPGDPPAWAMVAAVLAVLAIGLIAWRRTPRGSLARFGLILAALAYVPAANLVGLSRWTADSYLYLPLVGLAVGLPSLGAALVPSLSRLSRPIWAALAVSLGMLSFVQADRWSSSTALWTPVAERYPELPVALARVGLGQLHDGNRREGAITLLELRRRFPAYDELLCHQAWASWIAGELQSMQALLERGLRERQHECLSFFTEALLREPGPLRLGRDELRRLGELALPGMTSVGDRRGFEALAARLVEAGLLQDAMRVRRLGSRLPSR